ncbi:MAG: UvrD-helicase domain-containing protein [bacterium]|nr:UvrD-helicase domain-containing protein [bacterium]
MSSKRNQLNAEQLRAVKYGDGPLLIVAGAGTGKTTVITRRLAWLIEEKKAAPDEILALTFTDKAAGEMEERVDVLLPYGYVDLWISTFHAFGERVLKDHALDMGLDPGFQILTQPDQWMLIRQNLGRFGLQYYRPLGNPTRFITALVKHFSRLKDEHIEPEEYVAFAEKLANQFADADDDKKEEAAKTLELAKAYATYQGILHEQGLLDFGDLVLYALKLFQTRKSVLEKYRRQFKYVLVDEFQDTNFAQYELVKLLAGERANITVCGDDDQSVYKFRGASVSNILQFKKDYPRAREVVLVQNYRNKQNILDLSYEFIQLNNPNRLEAQLKDSTSNEGGDLQPISKKLLSRREGQAAIEHIHAESRDREVAAVVKKIVSLQKKHQASWNDFAILVRANDMADPFISALNAQGLPYQFIASKGLFQRPEIIDLVSYLKLLDNYHESNAAYRILSLEVFGIPVMDITKILHHAGRKSVSVFEAMQEVNLLGVEKETKSALEQILKMIREHTELTRFKTAGQILYRFVTESGYMERLTKKETLANAERILNINRFFKKIADFESKNDDRSVKNFMVELNTMLEIGQDPAPSSIVEGPESIKIMTIHGAKGLEFPYVFIVHLVDKRFPTIERREELRIPDQLVKEIVPSGDVHLQEERRLFYVAVTRARDGLFFTTADDYGGQRKKKLSRFLKEIAYEKYVKSVGIKKAPGLDYPDESKTQPRNKKLRYELPRHLSFTQLKAFWTCPYQYRFMFVLKVPQAPKHTFSFGKSIHNTLHQFFQLVQRGEQSDWAAMKKLYEANWIDEWYESPEHMAERKAQGLKALRTYFDSHDGKFPKPLYLEKGFVIKVDQQSIRGVIDRVDEFADQSVEVIDYKTGKKPQSKKVDNPEQLLIYAMAVSETLKRKPARLTYHYLEDNQKVSFKPTDETISKVREKISQTAKELPKSDFRPTPGFHCKFCDFKDICEYRQV